MRIYNSIDHRVAFDSRLKYARVIEVPSGTFLAQATDGTQNLYSKSYPAGATYAYAVLVQGMSSYFKTISSTVSRACSAILSVSLNSSRALTISATTATDPEPLNRPGTTANTAQWMVAILDITGY